MLNTVVKNILIYSCSSLCSKISGDVYIFYQISLERVYSEYISKQQYRTFSIDISASYSWLYQWKALSFKNVCQNTTLSLQYAFLKFYRNVYSTFKLRVSVAHLKDFPHPKVEKAPRMCSILKVAWGSGRGG